MDLVHRLNHRLRETARRELPAAVAGEPITVAEIYQRLIPYRAVRSELGIVELAEYEHALLRLLAGEGGYLRVEVPEAREEIRRELSGSHPILGIYRDYAAVPVRLVADPAAEQRTEPWPPPAPVRSAEPAPAARSEPLPQATPTADACRHCREPLPNEDDVRFCPHCGTSQREIPCAGCGAMLRTGWSYCIRCGLPRPGRPEPR